MDKEDFLLLRVVEASEEDLPHVDALYFLKILSKLESCGRPDVVVDVADAAIKTLVASGNETNVSTLYSLLFRHHLDAGHIYVSWTVVKAVSLTYIQFRFVAFRIELYLPRSFSQNYDCTPFVMISLFPFLPLPRMPTTPLSRTRTRLADATVCVNSSSS